MKLRRRYYKKNKKNNNILWKVEITFMHPRNQGIIFKT
jgi:hypothetical protein